MTQEPFSVRSPVRLAMSQISVDASVWYAAVFSGVSEFPVRVKCASLAWHTLKAALEGQNDTVSTE